MTELAHSVLEPLWEDREFILFRGVRDGDRSPILVETPALAQPAPESLQRLEHAYGLREELDPAWAARPLELVWHQGRPTLVLADPGGEPLARLVGQPWEMTTFLRIALGLAVALGRLHRRGLIHMDVKPANIFVDTVAGEVRLTGFGIASRLRRERQVPAPPEVIAGTLAYMAPEQTGRMNRSIDARSDLYALGVTLYEMVTGSLPFTASEPLEWVHCHIARQPVPPAERRTEVPGVVSAMVMKLLAKTAEERYQTAAGVAADLQRCLVEWEAYGRINSFPLGAYDIPDRLLIPEKLYGRARESETLLASFERVVTSGTPELVLVSGYSGIGKSSVVNELHKVLVRPRGLFASGKFDQFKRDIPYATVAQAFQSLLRPLLSKSEAELDSWRQALREALGPNGRLMVDLVPELKLIIGEQPPVPELPPQDAQRRFQLVFRRFISVFARPEHPLALFLDDLQWLDAATLDLLEDLLTQPDVRYVLLIGAYRDNEVDAAHPLRRKLAAIRKVGARVQEILLAPLACEDLGRLLADSLHCEAERVAPLAQLVHEKTAGNPFFAIQFISTLAEEGLLTFDHAATRWSWDLNRIHATGYTDNVVDLMVGKLHRLPVQTQQALQQLACIGNSAGFALLAMIHEDAKGDLHDDLWEAVRTGLVFRSEDAYRFLHDRVQEAAYSLIPEEGRAAAHLRIGRLLAAHTPPEKREEATFELVNQLNRGAALITEQKEREQLAELNLIAGTRAKNSTAYASALTYLLAGAALLAEDCWERRQELAFALELHRADCEFWTGALPSVEERLAALASRAVDTVQRAAVASRRVDLYTMLGASDRSVEVGLECLRHAGIDWTAHPTELEARREYERIWSQLGSRAIEDLIDLPLMQDSESLATLDVLTALGPPTLYTDGNLLALTSCRAVNLSLERGNSDAAPPHYASVGLMAGDRFGDYDAGYRLAKMGCDLTERRGLKRFGGKTYSVFSLVVPWTRPVRECINPERRSFQMANEQGDATYAAYACWNLTSGLLAAGDPLEQAEREFEHGLEFARTLRFGFVADMMYAPLALARTLRGETAKFGLLDDGRFTERSFEERLTGHPALALPECFYWIRKLQARFIAGDYASAIEAAKKAERWFSTSASLSGFLLERAEYHLYAALSRAACCEPMGPDPYAEHREALAAHHRQLRAWAANCPENFEDGTALVGAEITRIEGRPLEAMDLYERALRSAHANGFVHHEALAHELAGRFALQRGFETAGAAHLRHARACYALWGADGKVRHLEQLYPQLGKEELVPGPTSTIGAPVEQLDLATVLKVSQAVSGEIVLDKLIDTLMRTALEHAGAARGLLMLPRGAELRVEAEATIRGETVTVWLRAASQAALPESVLHYVVRTQESVILDDASAQNSFSADVYLRQTPARSVLCLPLVKQARLIGVLYLENNLTSHVFTPARLAVLQLLASQAAISLENARLYTDLQHENRERQQAEARLRQSEAYLAEAQRLSRTGSFGWQVASGALVWSGETYRLFGLDRATTPTVDLVLQRTHPDDVDFARETLERAARDGTNLDFEHRFVLPGGAVKDVHVVAQAVRDEQGALEYVGAVMDITATKQAQQALESTFQEMQALRDQHRLVIDNISGLVWSTLPDGQADFFNQRWLDYTGLSFAEARGWGWTVPVHPEDLGKLMDTWLGLLACGEPGEEEARLRRVDGEYRWFLFRAVPLRDNAGHVVKWYGTNTDIDDRKQAEEKLRRSEESLLEAQRISHTGSWRHDVASGTVTVSPEVHRIFGNKPDEDTSTAEFFFSRIHPEDRPLEVCNYERARLTKAAFESDYRIVLPDGSIKHIHNTGHPIVNESGELLKFVGTSMDVTEQYRARVELEKAFEEIKHLKDRLHDENVVLREELDQASMFEEIVGASPALQAVLARVAKVAPTDSTVLITGETGTGKELIARAIHKHSPRAAHTFVSVNCAAIPPSLIAAELFGHEKGAFTGAVQRRLGRFELAEGGTLFLDEIGDLPAETQVALLRVLQEHEFERVGGTRVMRADVRVIAATNRNLQAAIADGTFRSDLFYRLNVFPLELPPLRERQQDIPLLVEYFLDRYATKAGKKIRSINKKTLELLQAYRWPGNIRELQNVIERSVIVCESETFAVDESWLAQGSRPGEPASPALGETLEAQEKNMIEAALAATRGRVSGPSGAAAKLGIAPSTLENKIRSLKINKHRFKTL